MARIRTIKPEFFRHHELYTLEDETKLPLRVSFIGLLTAADKAGRFRWRPAQLKLDCCPFDPIDFTLVLAVLERGRFIQRYEVNGTEYGYIPGWHRHQRPRSDEEDSQLPTPPTLTVAGTDSSLHSDESVPAQTRGREGKGREGKGKEEEHGETRSARDLVFPVDGKPNLWSLPPSLITAWQREYPTLNVREQCERALKWVQRNPTKKKKASGMNRFLGNWLDREQHGYPGKNGNRAREHPISRDERERAVRHRRSIGGCHHDPRCASFDACIGTIVRDWRQQEAEGLGGHE